MTLPLIRAAKNRHVGCHTIVYQESAYAVLRVAGVPAAELLPSLETNRFARNVSLFRLLRRTRYAVAYHNHVASGMKRCLFWPWFAGIRKRVGSERRIRWQKAMLTRECPRTHAGKPLHETRKNLLCLGDGFARADCAYRIESLVRVEKRDTTIGLHPGSDNIFAWSRRKRWPAVRFAELCRRILMHNASARIAVFLGPKEEDLVSIFRGLRVTLVRGRPLEDVCREIAACRHFVANDSGLAHIAYAAGLTPHVLFGQTDYRETGPLKCVPILSADGDMLSISAHQVWENLAHGFQ
ncbi:MAG: glycosyltransferase family 9 protein [Kiritimatiellae bacterium]|nr:glycosyltransferase family 9 protein [Kiritimatiellia bacterium]